MSFRPKRRRMAKRAAWAAVFLLFLAWIPPTEGTGTDCASLFGKVGTRSGTCLVFLDRLSSGCEAEEACQRLGGQLVEPRDAKIMADLNDLVKHTGHSYVWIGVRNGLNETILPNFSLRWMSTGLGLGANITDRCFNQTVDKGCAISRAAENNTCDWNMRCCNFESWPMCQLDGSPRRWCHRERCMNDGTCKEKEDGSGFTCECPSEFNGTRCQLKTNDKEINLRTDCIERETSGKNFAVGNKCLTVHSENMTWFEAQEECALKGGSLLVELDTIDEKLHEMESYWIGVRRAPGEKNFYSTPGGEYNRTQNYGEIEAENELEFVSHCVVLREKRSSVEMSSRPCEEKNFFVCETEVENLRTDLTPEQYNDTQCPCEHRNVTKEFHMAKYDPLTSTTTESACGADGESCANQTTTTTTSGPEESEEERILREEVEKAQEVMMFLNRYPFSTPAWITEIYKLDWQHLENCEYCDMAGTFFCHPPNADFPSAVCECHKGYLGQRCQVEEDECSSNPCVHGTCIDLRSDFNCSCWYDYKGKQCEIFTGRRPFDGESQRVYDIGFFIASLGIVTSLTGIFVIRRKNYHRSPQFDWAQNADFARLVKYVVLAVVRAPFILNLGRFGCDSFHLLLHWTTLAALLCLIMEQSQCTALVRNEIKRMQDSWGKLIKDPGLYLGMLFLFFLPLGVIGLIAFGNYKGVLPILTSQSSCFICFGNHWTLLTWLVIYTLLLCVEYLWSRAVDYETKFAEAFKQWKQDNPYTFHWQKRAAHISIALLPLFALLEFASDLAFGYALFYQQGAAVGWALAFSIAANLAHLFLRLRTNLNVMLAFHLTMRYSWRRWVGKEWPWMPNLTCPGMKHDNEPPFKLHWPLPDQSQPAPEPTEQVELKELEAKEEASTATARKPWEKPLEEGT